MENEYSIWLDDERPMPKDYDIKFTSAWDLIAFVEMKFGNDGTIPRKISLDHDLGDPLNGTGYDVACWLEEQYQSDRFREPITLLCHSANPSGRDRIEAALKRCIPKSI